MPSEDDPVLHARSACVACRTGKRRCDRTIPSCNLCIRKQVACSYPNRRNKNQDQLASRDSPRRESSFLSPESDLSGRGYDMLYCSGSIGVSDPAECDTTALYFLAPDLYHQAKLSLPQPELRIPADVSSFIGNSSSIHSIASSFFIHIQRWLPIVSKRDFFTSLLSPLGRRRMELSLLTLCMKLCCTGPSDGDGDSGVKSMLYRTAKRFHHEVESAGVMSIHVLQAQILIALYELGQAIYPSAYLTVGACARYGMALGIDKFTLGSTGAAHIPYDWEKFEEGKRVWWAVLIFDRFLSLSNPLRPLSTEDPNFDTYLPVDDEAWANPVRQYLLQKAAHIATPLSDDLQTANPIEALRISNGFTLRMGCFARLAQSTYLLSQALRSLQPLATTESEGSREDNTAQIRRTLVALVNTTVSEVMVRKLEFCAQSALSLSTVLLLQEHHHHQGDPADGDGSNARPLAETLWLETNTALDDLASAAASCNASCVEDLHAADHVPIFLLHAMYQAACRFLAGAQVDRNGDKRSKFEEIKRLLRSISPRWHLAGVYLSIIEAREVALSIDVLDMPPSVF